MSKRWLPLAAALAVAIPSRIPQCEEAKQAPANEQSSTPHEQPAFAPVQAPAVSPGAHPSPAANTRNDRQQQEHWINKAWRHWARRFFSDLKITDALIAIF